MADGDRGTVHQAAYRYLKGRPRELEALEPFLRAGFDVKRAEVVRGEGTELTAAFLKADKELSEAYGFEYEILLAYSGYSQLQPRSLRLAEKILQGDKAKGRVEPLWYFLLSMAPDAEDWTRKYLSEHRESKIAVPFSVQELIKAVASKWFIRNKLQSHFLTVDRFKYNSPLREDTYFFGRTAQLGQMLDSVRRSQHIGLYGLRKTGKTSLLFKLERLLKDDSGFEVVRIDAQSPAIRKRRWHQLLSLITDRLVGEVETEGGTTEVDEITASDRFLDAMRGIAEADRRALLVIDEVEWISPGTAKDQHWNSDYLEFWQVIRTCQGEVGHFSVVVAGVNPALAEVDRFDNFQNPMFGIISPMFLSGLQPDETTDMISKIGKLMGVRFGDDAAQYLNQQYAGHPLLTRLACSHTVELARANGEEFPLRISKGKLVSQEKVRNSELLFYVRHLVAELEEFYPEEYSLLETLATGGYEEFRQAAKVTGTARHLFSYGVVTDEEYPYVTYDVVRKYVALENARREGRPWRMKLVAPEERQAFVATRMKNVIEDMQNLEKLIHREEKPTLFGPNSFPESHRLTEIRAPQDQDSWDTAMKLLHRCFVESVDRVGSHLGKQKYFWSDIQSAYPFLHDALHRIRVYRNEGHHLELHPGIDKTFRSFLERDLEDALLGSDERYWALFQRTVDALFQAIQRETVAIESGSSADESGDER